jgi:MFS family permease
VPSPGDASARSSVLSLAKHWWPAILLGVLTVGTYGFSFYSFGVFLEPISEDTGWSKGGLSTAFAVSSLGGAAGGVFTGRILDARGPRPVFLVAIVLGSVLLFMAGRADTQTAFILLWGIGAGAIAAGLFYNVTMATTARLYPDDRAMAFTVLTVVGGFASPIFFPLAGFLVSEFGWRDAITVLVVVQVVFVVPALLFLPRGAGVSDPDAAADAEGGEQGFGSIREAIRSRQVVQMTAMFAISGMALSALQVHHVSAFQATGLTVGAAASIAAIRGVLSLPGRAALAAVQGRLGTQGATLLVYVAMVIGTLLLLAAGHIAFIWAFVIVTGLTFGTVLPLQGLYSAEVFGDRKLGTMLGAQHVVISIAGAVGPLIVGFTVDATDSYRPALTIIAILQAVAILLLLTRPRQASRSENDIS